MVAYNYSNRHIVESSGALFARSLNYFADAINVNLIYMNKEKTRHDFFSHLDIVDFPTFDSIGFLVSNIFGLH